MRRAQFPIAPLDRATRIMTLLIMLFLVVVVPLLIATGEEHPAVFWTGLAAGITILVVGLGMSPGGYDIGPATPCTVTIRRRLFGSKTFEVTGNIGTPSWHVGFGGMRLGGSSGLFGWYGRFWRADIGRYQAYITDRSKLVSVETERGLLLLSPADPRQFVAALEQAKESS